MKSILRDQVLGDASALDDVPALRQQPRALVGSRFEPTHSILGTVKCRRQFSFSPWLSS
jgi:hypothetical protein